MSYRPATGRPMAVPSHPITVRDHMRHHLRRAGMDIKDLAPVWDQHQNSVYRRFYDKRPFTPNYIETFIEAARVDPLDAAKLRLLAAREAGWNLELKYLKLVT